MLINFSNHPFDKWSSKQKDVALAEYGSVVDISFPMVNPAANTDYVEQLAQKYLAIITDVSAPNECAVHIMGELNLSFSILKKLQDLGYVCVASTTNRLVVEKGPNEKEVKFDFVQFRKF